MYKFGFLDSGVGSSRRQSARTLLCSNREGSDAVSAACVNPFPLVSAFLPIHSFIHIRLLRTEMTERICTSNRNTRRI